MIKRESFVGTWIAVVRRRWRTGAVVFGVVMISATLLLLLSRPVHRSESLLRLGAPPPQGGVSPTAGVLSFFQLGGDAFANDLELLSSRTLAETVVERVALTARLDARRGWHRDSLLAVLRTDRDTRRATFEIAHEDGRVRVRRTSPGDSVVGEFAPGELVTFSGLTAAFLPHREGMPSRFELSTFPFAEAVRRTRSSLSVQRPRREANVVAVSYDHADPGVADAVVAAAVEGFIGLRTSLQQRESGQTMDSLRTVARQTAAELRAAEESLKELQSRALLVAPEAQSAALVARQSELLMRLARATSELAGVDEMLRRLDESGGSERGWTALLSYPAFLESQTLGELLAELTTLHAKRTELASRRSADTREVQALDRQIEYLDGSLRSVASEYRVGLEAQVGTLRPQVAQMERVLGALPEQATEFLRRQREVRVLTEVVVVTEQRLRQEEMRNALTYANVQVIDPPALLDRPIWPRPKLGMAVALLLATAFAVLGMGVRDRVDGGPRGVAEIGPEREGVRAAWG